MKDFNKSTNKWRLIQSSRYGVGYAETLINEARQVFDRLNSQVLDIAVNENNMTNSERHFSMDIIALMYYYPYKGKGKSELVWLPPFQEKMKLS